MIADLKLLLDDSQRSFAPVRQEIKVVAVPHWYNHLSVNRNNSSPGTAPLCLMQGIGAMSVLHFNFRTQDQSTHDLFNGWTGALPHSLMMIFETRLKR